MSVRAMDVVWRHSRAKGTAKLLLLAIADCANDEGEQAWPNVGTLGRKTGVTVRAVQLLLADLDRSGELQVSWGTGPRGTNRYSLRTFLEFHARLVAETGGEGAPGVARHGGVTRFHPEKISGVKPTSPGGVKLILPEGAGVLELGAGNEWVWIMLR